MENRFWVGRRGGPRFARILAAALAVALALALASCSGGDKAQGSGGGPEQGGGSSEGAQNTGAALADGELVIGIPGSLSSLDVNQEAGILNYYVAAIVNEGLVSIGNDGKVIPALAESWSDEKGEVWKFKLRQGAKFSDGSPVTADDIIWSIERAQDPERSPGVSIYFPDYVKSAEKTADDEITITLEGSHGGFIWAVSNAGGLFVNKKEWGEKAEAIGSQKDLLLGSGPYKVVEFEPGSHATFEASGTWWGGDASIPKIRFDFIEDDATRLLAFTQGDIDFALNIPVDQSEQWESVDGAKVEYIADRSYYGLTFDPNVEPFGDEHIRKAVSHAIDAGSIVDGSILKGHGTVATAITPPEQLAAALTLDAAKEKLDGITHYEYDIEKAKEELAQSSRPDGFETTLYYPDTYQNAGKASLVIAESLKEIGITLDVKEIPIDQWLNEVGDGKQGVAWMIYFPTTAEPGEIAGWLLDAEGAGTNPANWTDAEAAELAARILGAESLEAEIEPTIQANEIAQKQAIYAPVWWGQSAVAYGGGVTVDDYGSFSLISQNWPQLFSLG
ncbi:MAG: ABC transporter substrate-binding protein [Clostridiales Family XIII bacterium]|jgi:peptide/nickel transport system substrate-binding protein|nr:ABC transporter substrate-binding protein [Clostridiales Family XIII bacterium]